MDMAEEKESTTREPDEEEEEEGEMGGTGEMTTNVMKTEVVGSSFDRTITYH